MKKRTVVLIIAIVSVLILIGTVLAFARYPRIPFMLSEYFDLPDRDVKLEEIDPACTGYTLAELETLESVSFIKTCLLINSHYLLSEDFEPDLVEYNGAAMSSEILDAYRSLSQDIQGRFDTPLYVISSYRTKEEQEEIVGTHDSDVAAGVGASEHQSGLALDVYVKGYSGKALIDCEAGQYLNTDCWRHGFIVRYPIGKKNITGITYEPWHIRYIGIPHAEIISKRELTAEEYFEKLIPNSFFSFGDYVISRQSASSEQLLIPNGAKSVVISEDNQGFYLITATMQ